MRHDDGGQRRRDAGVAGDGRTARAAAPRKGRRGPRRACPRGPGSAAAAAAGRAGAPDALDNRWRRRGRRRRAGPFAAAGTGAALALARGRLVHRLLECLPEIAAEDRHAVGAAYLAAFARPLEDWPEAERDALLAEVLAVMAEPGFAPVFAPGSRAEVEIAGRISRASGEPRSPAASTGWR